MFAATHVSWFKVLQEFTEKGHEVRAVDASLNRSRRYEATTGYLKGCPMGFGHVTMDSVIPEHDLAIAEKLGP